MSNDGDGTLFDAREAFADEERGGDLLWSATPAQPIPLRPRDGDQARGGPPARTAGGPRRPRPAGRPAEPAAAFSGDTAPLGLTPHDDPPTGRVARLARAAAVQAGEIPPRAPSGGPGARPLGPAGRPARGRSDAPSTIVPPARKGGPRRLAEPRPTRVRADERGRPLAVDGRAVEGIRESWLVEDRWWTDRPLRRRYWEVVTDDGRDLVVFRELGQGGWYRQRG
jgi:hypothetical protein